MVTYPRLITDFDHKLLGSVAPAHCLALHGGRAWACSTLRFGWGLHGLWRCRVRPRGLAAFGGMPLSRRNTWKATLSVPLPGLWQCKRACAAKVCVAVVSRSVFLSGKAAKKNYEHPYAPSRSPLHHRPRVYEQVSKCQQNPRMLGWENRGILAGLCLKVENSRVAANNGSYPAILPL